MTARPYRVLVTGSRDWVAEQVVRRELSRVWREAGGPVVVVHGACPTGADAQAAQWVADWSTGFNGVAEERHPAQWRTNGKAAGFIRNAHMVNLGADVVLAFIRNGSRGASHTAALAEQAGISVRRFTN
ncbi:SLOG family protein [Streptomyces sp. NPDC005900]|uniref:SLOG family protein n=1 Tax=Streptomyces sp. NPDC005900 TaxID=3154569 RepID=UPI0033F61863